MEESGETWNNGLETGAAALNEGLKTAEYHARELREPGKARSLEESLMTASLNLAEVSDAQTDISGCSRSPSSFLACSSRVLGPISAVRWFAIHQSEAGRPWAISRSSGSALLTWDQCHAPKLMRPYKARGQYGGGMLRKPSMILYLWTISHLPSHEGLTMTHKDG